MSGNQQLLAFAGNSRSLLHRLLSLFWSLLLSIFLFLSQPVSFSILSFVLTARLSLPLPPFTSLPFSLLVSPEGRYSIGDGCYPAGVTADAAAPANSRRDIVMKTSTDGGLSWSALRTIADFAQQPNCVYDSHTDTMVLQYLNISDFSNYQISSTDDGATWSAPSNLKQYLGAANGVETGPGRGLVLRADNPVAPNRLLFIGHLGAYTDDYVFYSDDGGATYSVATPALAKMDEAQLVELSDGTVVANMRNDHLNKSCDCRAIAVSKDGGATFGDITYDPALPSPVCQASIMSFTSKVLLFSNPASKTGRVRRGVSFCFSFVCSWLRF